MDPAQKRRLASAAAYLKQAGANPRPEYRICKKCGV